MTEPTVSAVPEDLRHYIDVAANIAGELTHTAAALADGLAALERDANRHDVTLQLPDIRGDITTLVHDLHAGAQRLSAVHDAVSAADRTVAIDAVTIPATAVPAPGDGRGEPGEALFAIGPPTRPYIAADRDYPGHARAPGPADAALRAKWEVMLRGGQVRTDLDDATALYLHYLGGSGTPVTVDYEELYREDPHVRDTVDHQVALATSHADRLARDQDLTTFSITGDLMSAEVPFPGRYATATDNGQKTLGDYSVWSSADVRVDGDLVTMTVTVHAEDRYNFNDGAADLETGIPDNENVRFAQVGWAKGFEVTGTATRTVTWRLGDPPPSSQLTDSGEPTRNPGREDREDNQYSSSGPLDRPGSDTHTGGQRAER